MSYNKKTGLYEGYIYLISNNINSKVYIGQTSSTIRFRWYQHKSAAKTNTNKDSVLYNAINKHGFDNFKIEIVNTYYCKNKKELNLLLNNEEIHYVKKYNSLKPNGYNMTLGGENTSERIKTPVDAYYGDGTLYKEYSSIVEAIHDIGYEVNVSSVSYVCKGKQQSCCGYVWRYHGDPFDKYNVTLTPEMISRYNNRCPVDKYSLSGLFLGTYDTMTEALNSIGKTKEFSTPIKLCCQNKRSQAYGFVWRFRGDDFNNRKLLTHNDWTCVDVYDKNLNFISTYQSYNEAIRNLDLKPSSHSGINLCCDGKLKFAYGYIWRRHGEDLFKYGKDFFKRKKKRTIKINKYSVDNLYIDTYKSYSDVSKQCDISIEGVRKAINSNSHYSKGYKWYAINDPNQPDKTKIVS